MDVPGPPETAIQIASQSTHPPLHHLDSQQIAIESQKRCLWFIFIPTGLPLIHHRWWIMRIVIVLVSNAILGAGTFSLLFFPNYYMNQEYIWTADLCIGWIVYNYMLFIHSNWDAAVSVERLPLKRRDTIITGTFTVLYYIYWLYFYVIQNILHSKPVVMIQLGNALMGSAWYLFFSMMASLYYTICHAMLQRAQTIRLWLKSVKRSRLTLQEFYAQYNLKYKGVRKFGKYWTFLVFLGFLLLSFHIPIDLFSVVYSKNYYDSFGLIIKSFSLFWYIYCICELNDYDTALISYLYKHRLYPLADLTEIEKYVEYRPLGLDFYGIKLNHSTMTKVVIIVLNFVVPTIYALVSNKIFG
jgi:hypothetical protein